MGHKKISRTTGPGRDGSSTSSSTLENLGDIIFSWKFLYYVIGVVAFTTLGFYICSDIPDISTDTARASLEVFLVALLVILLSLAVLIADNDIKHLPHLSLATLVFVAPVACLFLQFTSRQQEIAFWATIVIWTLFGFFFVRGMSRGGEKFTEDFIGGIGAAWAVSSAIISL